MTGEFEGLTPRAADLDYAGVARYWQSAKTSVLGPYVSVEPNVARIPVILDSAFPELTNHFFVLRVSDKIEGKSSIEATCA